MTRARIPMVRAVSACAWAVALLLAAPSTRALADAPAGAIGGGAEAVTQPLILTDAQVKGFLDATEELRASGELATVRADASGKTGAIVEGVKFSAESEAILKKHGFADVHDFQRVAYNASLAYGVLKRGGKQAVDADLAKSNAQQQKALEQMKQSLPPDQYEKLAAQMQGAVAQSNRMQNVPEQNLEVVGRYRERMAALSSK